ncbi:MAG: GNAT family N-acetyltransferase [Pseudoflavonifractor sp.]
MQCDQAQQETLVRFLERDAVYHTFILSDMLHYGFQAPFQQIYMQTSPGGDCTGVFLRYYHNLILAGEAPGAEFPALWALVGGQVSTVMGKAALVQGLQEACDLKPWSLAVKDLYALPGGEHLLPPLPAAEEADLENVDAIHDFLMQVPQFRALYGEKAMIENRIRQGDGRHLTLTQNGQIAAHANSAAGTELACMVGGVAVAEALRGRGLGHQIVSELCRRLRAGGQTPCLFSDYPPSRSLFCDLGFEKVGTWGVLEQSKKV